MSPRVCLVISAYKSDAAIIRLLEQAAAFTEPPWTKVLVVDSLGSGAIPAELARRGWSDRVEYRSFDTNLGSAGNLSMRLKLAAEQGFDFAYALNHDGLVDAELVRSLLGFAASRDPSRLGAVYPLRRYTRLGGRFDLTGASRLPVPFRGSRTPPRGPALAVHWASSNGALYALAPVRSGLAPWADFWMGWEDLAYGWLLESAGYDQWVATDVVLDDDYEYVRKTVGKVSVSVSDKPVWYSYYQARNLVLAAARTKADLPRRGMVAARVLMECGATLATRSKKLERLELLARGVFDGLRGVAGKGKVP